MPVMIILSNDEAYALLLAVSKPKQATNPKASIDMLVRRIQDPLHPSYFVHHLLKEMFSGAPMPESVSHRGNRLVEIIGEYYTTVNKDGDGDTYADIRMHIGEAALNELSDWQTETEN